MHSFIPHHLLDADSMSILGARAGLTKTVPGRQVQIQDFGFPHETLESGKTGQGLFFPCVSPRTVPT